MIHSFLLIGQSNMAGRGYVCRHDFKVFGWYRIVLGIIVLLFSYLPLFVK